MTTRTVPGGPVGYSLPLSPAGTSAALTPPPWHFSGDVVMVDYRVDPEAAARFLPDALDPGPDAGAAAAVFASWQWCSASGDELADPARCQFGEFLILLSCAYRGRPTARCPYAWVDSAVPLLRGWVQGMPKQMGEVHQSRVATVGRAGPVAAPGGRFAASLSVHGRRLVELSVRLTAEGPPPPLHTVPLVHSRVFPSWDPGRPRTDELVLSEVSDVEFGPVHTGPAAFTLDASGDEELASLAPVSLGAGHVFGYAETLRGGRALD